MPRPVVQTVQEVKEELVALTRIIFLRETGVVWTHRDTDPVVLVLDAIAQKIHNGQASNLKSYLDMLPGRQSSEIDVWVGMFDIQREAGELSADLWDRQQIEVNNYSSATEPALRDLALSVENVQDVHFSRRVDRDLDFYLVSSAPPPAGELPGSPSTTLNDQLNQVMNNTSIIHIDDELFVQDPNVVGYLVELTVNHRALNLPALQLQVNEIVKQFVIDTRSFTRVPDASRLARVLDIEGINHLSEYGFRLTTTSPRRERLPAVANGFYSCTEEILAEPAALEANKIHIKWAEVV